MCMRILIYHKRIHVYRYLHAYIKHIADIYIRLFADNPPLLPMCLYACIEFMHVFYAGTHREQVYSCLRIFIHIYQACSSYLYKILWWCPLYHHFSFFLASTPANAPVWNMCICIHVYYTQYTYYANKTYVWSHPWCLYACIEYVCIEYICICICVHSIHTMHTKHMFDRCYFQSHQRCLYACIEYIYVYVYI